MGFSSTWQQRCPPVLRIKGRSLSSDSASVLLSEGSEASHLCRERNWIRSLFRLSIDSHARAKAGVTLQSAGFGRSSLIKILERRHCVSIAKPNCQILQRLQKRIIKGEALYFFAWHVGFGFVFLFGSGGGKVLIRWKEKSRAAREAFHVMGTAEE